MENSEQFEIEGIQFVTDRSGKRTAVMVDLELHGEAVQEFLEDLEDLKIIEERKNDSTIPWEEVKKELIAKGKLDPDVQD